MTDEEYEVVLGNTVKEIAAQQKWIDDQKAAFDRVLQTRRDLAECRQQLAEARAALNDWYNYLHDEDDWDDMVSPASHQWRERHATALKAAREAK